MALFFKELSQNEVGEMFVLIEIRSVVSDRYSEEIGLHLKRVSVWIMRRRALV